MEYLSLADYFAVFKRRKKIFFYIATTFFLLAFLFAANWSNYRATATVEVAQSDIDTTTTSPQETSSLADLRISRLQQKVLSIGSLVEIIKKFDLYERARKKTPVARIAEAMYKKIKLKLISSTLANPASANKASAGQLSAIAFTLSFDYSDPLLAQQVTDELVNRFLSEDTKESHKQARQTSAFLEEQLKLLEDSLAEQEKNIALFRAENGDVSPESFIFNQQITASTLMSLQNVESQITANLGTQGTLRASLATTSPYARTMADGQILTTPSIQLKALQSEYATLTAKYGDAHPDVIKAKRQIKSLKVLTNPKSNSSALRAKISDAKARLKAANKTNGPDHPDVKTLQKQLKKYKSQLASTSRKRKKKEGLIKSDADNPTYLRLATQLQAVQEQYKALVTQREALKKEQEKYTRAIAQNPAVEQRFAALTRDYDNAQMRYRELKERKMLADMNKAIEQGRSGQRLVLANPPGLPMGTQPSRKLFVLGGFVFALLGGLVGVFVLQFISQSVIGPRHMAALVGVEPLVCVPRIKKERKTNG